MATTTREFKFIDIGVNLTDSMFDGKYHGRRKHDSDRELVMKRAWSSGMTHMLVTCGSKKDLLKAKALLDTDERLFVTVGVHPTRCNELAEDTEKRIDELVEIAKSLGNRVVAVGEFGLDYDRLKFCNAEVQRRCFEAQFRLCDELRLPLFLHERAAGDDFCAIVERNRARFKDVGAVVHSFTGSVELMRRYVDMGFYIGINGCSLKTEANLDVARQVPLDRLMLETDAPWCEIRASHAGRKHVSTRFDTVNNAKRFTPGQCVKGRCEPCHIVQVLEVLAGIRTEDIETIANTVYETTRSVFFWH
jgi:TatD DNase family protein